MISPDQIRAARALLHLQQDQVARCADVSLITIRRLESVGGAHVSPGMAERVRRALELLGAEFIENGVRRRSPVDDPAVLARDMQEIARRSAVRQAALPSFSETDLYNEDGLPS